MAEPTTLSSRTGADGEAAIGRMLEQLAEDGVRVVHDRRIPGSRANIEHIAVAPTGVYVIDAKSYEGVIELRRRGPLFARSWELDVRGRNQTKWIAGMAEQLDAVAAVLDAGVPVHPTIVTVRVEWPLFARPITIDGVAVMRWQLLRNRLRKPGTLTPDDIDRLHRRLVSTLHAA